VCQPGRHAIQGFFAPHQLRNNNNRRPLGTIRQKRKFVNFCRNAKSRVFYTDAIAEGVFDLIAAAQQQREPSRPAKPTLQERVTQVLRALPQDSAATLGDVARSLDVEKSAVKAAIKASADCFELVRDGKKKRVRLVGSAADVLSQ